MQHYPLQGNNYHKHTLTHSHLLVLLSYYLSYCRKVLGKLGLELSGEVIRALTQCRAWAIESFLSLLRDKIDLYLAAKHGQERRYNGSLGASLHHQQQQYLSEPDMLHQWSSRSAFSDKTEVDQHHSNSHRNSGKRYSLA